MFVVEQKTLETSGKNKSDLNQHGQTIISKKFVFKTDTKPELYIQISKNAFRENDEKLLQFRENFLFSTPHFNTFKISMNLLSSHMSLDKEPKKRIEELSDESQRQTHKGTLKQRKKSCSPSTFEHYDGGDLLPTHKIISTCTSHLKKTLFEDREMQKMRVRN